MQFGKKRIFLIAAVLSVLLAGAAGAGAWAARRGWQPPGWLGFLRPGAARTVDVGLFCNEHGVPEKFCTLCHAELKDKLLLCAEHGNIPEAICTLCHPENAQKYGITLCAEHGAPESFCVQCNPALGAGEAENTWCGEHGLPESLCTLCKPELAKKVAMCREHGVPRALCTICRPALADNFNVCETHRLPVAFCPPGAECGPAAASAQCPLPPGQAAPGKTALPRVRFASSEVAERIGLETAPVKKSAVSPAITANCEVGYDETRLAHVRPRVRGIVREVRVQAGDAVRRGDVLAVIDSAELGQAKADYLVALPLVELWTKNRRRFQRLEDEGVVAGKKLLEAEAELARAKAQVVKARQRLQNLGLASDQIASLADEPAARRNLLQIVAPQDGTVIQRRAVSGEAVQATSELFAIADMSTVWAHLDVYERDLPRLAVGQSMTLRVPGLVPREFSGRVIWIDSAVDERTRTIHVRAEVDNPQGLLRANMFGAGEIHVGERHSSLSVPGKAIQWEGTSYVVFVKKAADLYEPRRVLRGADLGDAYALAWADLRPGEAVVTTGSFLLKTEILKGAIGAGCCGE
jgi:cobalt-zinc-cadmium efflux system membrane fusion protein